MQRPLSTALGYIGNNQNPGYTDILVDPKTDSSNPTPGANTSGSGSLKVISPLNETANEQNVFFGTFASNINNSYDFSVRANTALYTNVSFDILVAPGTPLSSSGNYGAIQVGFITASYGQDWITAGTVTIPASASSSWYHVSVPIDQTQDFGDVPGIALDINSYSGYPRFTITNWIDNISINASTNPPQQSTTNSTNYIGIDAGTNRNRDQPDDLRHGICHVQSIGGLELHHEPVRAATKNRPTIGRSMPTAKEPIGILKAIPMVPPRRASRRTRSWPTARRRARRR